MKKLIPFLFAFCFISTNFLNGETLKINHLMGDFYIYTSYKNLDGYMFPSNGMYINTVEGVVMFDTPWDTNQVIPLLDSIKLRHNKKVILCISTHFHDDRTAGLDILKKEGIKTFSSKLTYNLCKGKNECIAEFSFENDTTFKIGNNIFETYYPGAGHTADNIVIWFEKEKILYGGCFIKSEENNSLGNNADADIKEWKNSLKKMIKRFPKTRFVIPGHFDWNGKNLLKHTLNLIEREINKIH